MLGCWGQVRGACVDPDSVAIELLGTGREEGGVRAGLGAGSGVRRAACQGPSEAFPEERTRCAGSGVGGARSWRAEGPLALSVGKGTPEREEQRIR